MRVLHQSPSLLDILANAVLTIIAQLLSDLFVFLDQLHILSDNHLIIPLKSLLLFEFL